MLFSLPYKMTDYRKNATDKEPAIAGTPEKRRDHGNLPSYMSLAAKYGLGDEMTPGNSDNNKQTLDQEYQAYATAPCSPSTFDSLKFWEVGGDNISAQTLLTSCGRSIRRRFQPYSPWPWITFQFKHHQCHANAYFLLVLKRTPSGGIV